VNQQRKASCGGNKQAIKFRKVEEIWRIYVSNVNKGGNVIKEGNGKGKKDSKRNTGGKMAGRGWGLNCGKTKGITSN